MRRNPISPSVVALAGPNGAGKSTSGPTLVRDLLGITCFVDADTIARGLAAYSPESVALAAGRIMLRRIEALSKSLKSFAFESTLSGRSLAPWIERMIEHGYRFHIVFLWLPSAEFAIKRVRDRVRLGGHHVEDHVVQRRYRSGLANFFELYQPLATSWRFYDNSKRSPRLVAEGTREGATRVPDRRLWKRLREGFGHA